MACATFGLIIGGLVGGPMAKWLIQRHQIEGGTGHDDNVTVDGSTPNFEFPHEQRLITADAAIETLALFAGCLAFAQFMTQITQGTAVQLPTFVWALGGGVLIRNTLDYAFGFTVFDRAIDVQVSRLRQRLRDDSREPMLIKTVRGEGYVLACAVDGVASCD